MFICFSTYSTQGIKPFPRESRTGRSQLRTQIKGVRAQPALVSHHQKVTREAHPPSSSTLPAPGLLGDVVNEGAAAEAQLITLLGFVVIQSFHGSLRLSGKIKRKRSGRLMSRGRLLHLLSHM